MFIKYTNFFATQLHLRRVRRKTLVYHWRENEWKKENQNQFQVITVSIVWANPIGFVDLSKSRRISFVANGKFYLVVDLCFVQHFNNLFSPLDIILFIHCWALSLSLMYIPFAWLFYFMISKQYELAMKYDCYYPEDKGRKISDNFADSLTLMFNFITCTNIIFIPFLPFSILQFSFIKGLFLHYTEPTVSLMLLKILFISAITTFRMTSVTFFDVPLKKNVNNNSFVTSISFFF